MLDAVKEYLPSPLDVPSVRGLRDVDDDPDEMKEERRTADDEDFCAFAFKIMTDPFVGSLTFCRVYSGSVEPGVVVANPLKHGKERVGRMLQMHANSREDIKVARAGDIVAFAGFKNTTTGDTLCTLDNPIILEKMQFPQPVLSVAIEPESKADQEKLSLALQRLAQEDPSFRVTTDMESGQTVIAGMGELHLDVLVDRMKREFKVHATVGAPQVAYRETITRKAEIDYTHKKQTGGAGQFARIIMTFEPLERGEGFQFESTVVGGRVPKEYIPGVEKGLKSSLDSGPLAGYPVIDFKAVLTDGAFHDVDSSVLAFEIAARSAFREIMVKAGAVLLEPIMKVEVVTPEDYMGVVIGDISSRRGNIEGNEERDVSRIINALVPLANMFGYVNNLRSVSQGRASYTMQFDHYAKVPQNIVKDIQEKQSG